MIEKKYLVPVPVLAAGTRYLPVPVPVVPAGTRKSTGGTGSYIFIYILFYFYTFFIHFFVILTIFY